MLRARTTGLSAGEAVLGLVIEQPDRGFSLERRLAERFGPASPDHLDREVVTLRHERRDPTLRGA